MKEKASGLEMNWVSGVLDALEVGVEQTRRAAKQGEEEGGGDPDREADRERRQRAQGDVAAALDDRHAEPGERAELGPDHHRADDQDRRAEVDPDRGDQAGEDHEGEEVAAELGALRGARLDLLPDHRVGGRAAGRPLRPLGRARRAASRSARARSSRRGGRPAPCRSSISTLASSRAMSQRITSPPGLRAAPGEEDQVAGRRRGLEQVERPSRERSAGDDDPQVDHGRSVSAPGRSGHLGSSACSPTTTCTCARTRTDTPPERYFTAENVDRYLAAAAAAGDRGAGRLRARLPLPPGARPLAPPALGEQRPRRPRRLLRVRPRHAAAARASSATSSPAPKTAPRRCWRRATSTTSSARSTSSASDAGRPPGWDVWEGSGDPDEVWRRYFEALAECARSGLFDILAHPDLVKVWGGARPLPERDLRRFYEPAVEAIAESGIAVEVSTAGLRKPVGELYPARGFAEMCVEAGASFALSSDAHLPEHVGFAYDRARRVPRRASGWRRSASSSAASAAWSRSAAASADEPMRRDRLRQPPLRRGPPARSSAGSRSSTRAASPATPTPTSSPTR